MHLALQLSYEQCLCCGQTAPATPDAELCAACARALRFVRATGKVGQCPVCIAYADLYTSDYGSADVAWCETHATLVTRRLMPVVDDHRGDVRNIL